MAYACECGNEPSGSLKCGEFLDYLQASQLLRKDSAPWSKYVSKITGEARSKLLVRELASIWRDVKQILEENYGIRRTLDYYTCRMFSSGQGVSESIASWSSRVDSMRSELGEAAYRICEDEKVIGAMGLINHLAKACFVQSLSNERIQTIDRSRGETAPLSALIDTALEEESAILSARKRGF